MRILVVVQGGGGTRVSGPEIRAWALAHAFAEHHDVTVILNAPEATERDGMRLVAFSRGALVREARRADAVIAPQLPPYLLAALARSGTIAVSDQYDPVELELSVFTEQPGIQRYLRAQKLIRETQLRYADIVVVAGERQRGLADHELETLRIAPARRAPIVTVPFGLPAAPADGTEHPLRAAFPQIGVDDPVVLWWGKIWKWFDALTAIHAFALVVERRPDARLVISAGKAPTAKFDRSDRTEAARALSRDLGLLDRNVFFLDEWTEYDRRHEYIQDADLGLTLHADTPEAPFAARARYMDYLWCAVPCVLAHGDEIADRFGAADFARLVAPGDAAATAAALLELIERPDARAAAHAAGLALADRYRWSTLVEPLTAAIEARAQSARRPSSLRLARSVGGFYARRAADHLVEKARSVRGQHATA
jgi:glycosyltransferase involved in cell wall biosynthesis